jgi:hypothetical protein
MVPMTMLMSMHSMMHSIMQMDIPACAKWKAR